MKKTNGDGRRVRAEYTAWPYRISVLVLIQTKAGVAVITAGLSDHF